MAVNLIEAEWVSRWMARKVLRRARGHMEALGEDSAGLLDPLIGELTPTTVGEELGTRAQYSLYLLWRVHRRLVNAGEVDAAMVVLEVVLSFFK